MNLSSRASKGRASAAVASAMLAMAVMAVREPIAKGSDCGTSYTTPTRSYLPEAPVPEPTDPTPAPGRTPTDPTPTEPEPPSPTTPTDPTTPTEPAPTPTTPSSTPAPTPTPTVGPPTPPDSGRIPTPQSGGFEGASERKRPAARDLSAWEFWWATHRFEFLAAANHAAELTMGETSSPIYATTRAAVRPRLMTLATEAQDYRVRGAALAAAIRIATPEQVDEMGATVRDALRHHNLQIAMSVGNALSYSTSTPLVAAAHPVSKDEVIEAHVRGLVALALPGLWHESADHALVEFLKNPKGDDAPFIEGVLMALGSTHGAEGTAALERVVADNDRSPAHRATALTSLARRGLDARERLLGSLADRSVDVRRAAATGLGILPWAVAAADAKTLASLRETGKGDTAEALEALLARLTEDRAASLREGPVRDTCVRLGRVLVQEKDRSVRAAAALSLGRIARAAGATNAARILLADLAHTRDLREYDLIALGISRDPIGIPACISALVAANSSASTRAAAVLALGLADARPAASSIASMMTNDPSSDVRGYAALALAMLHDDAALKPIRAAFLSSKNLEATSNLAIALGLYGDLRDTALLTDRLKQGGSPRLRFNLVEALRLAGRPNPTAALIAIAEDSENDSAPDAIRAIAGVLAPNDGGKAARAPAFDHIHGEDYLLAYVVDP